MAAIFVCFWQLGFDTINRWDEARFGHYALEMLHRADFINYYFDGVAQPWTTKPPLGIWLIALSYKLFGFNEFALRFFSAIAGVLTFVVLFRLVSLYRLATDSLWICIIAMSCKGIVGNHVARTGDLDALLLLFLSVQLYGFLLFIDFNRVVGLLYFGFGLGLAFYAKGSAAIFYVPGLVLYAALRGKLMTVIRSVFFWYGLVLFALFPLSWYLLIKFFGNTFNPDKFGGVNIWQNLFIYDTWARFTENIEGQGNKSGLFVFEALERKFAPWAYLLLLQLVVLFWYQFKGIRSKLTYVVLSSSKLPSLGLATSCVFFLMSLVLSLSVSKLSWYVAPMIPLAAIIGYTLQVKVEQANKLAKVLFVFVLIFAFGKTIYRLDHPNINTISQMFRKNQAALQAASCILVDPNLAQDFRLYLRWNNEKVLNRSTKVDQLGSLRSVEVTLGNVELDSNQHLIDSAQFNGERVALVGRSAS